MDGARSIHCGRERRHSLSRKSDQTKGWKAISMSCHGLGRECLRGHQHGYELTDSSSTLSVVSPHRQLDAVW